ncbi:MAG: hypothetical protein AAF468_08410 [Pseudomonadota bacterium]
MVGVPLTGSVALLWAGLALGGNVIAASAKFQVPDLSNQILFQIGRAQFGWLAVAEWSLLAIYCLGWLMLSRFAALLCTVPVLATLGQQLWLIPLLNQRTDMVVAGQLPPESNIHLVYVFVELTKIAWLLGVGIFLCRQGSVRAEVG